MYPGEYKVCLSARPINHFLAVETVESALNVIVPPVSNVRYGVLALILDAARHTGSFFLFSQRPYAVRYAIGLYASQSH